MSRVLKQRKCIQRVAYRCEYTYRTDPGCGFSFPADARGNVLADSLTPAGRCSLARAECGVRAGSILDHGLIVRRWSYWEPGLIRCDCGRAFPFDDCWLNTCPDCGADYDGAGRRLGPRQQWGEETG